VSRALSYIWKKRFEKNGGDDETRTRDLCRDREAVRGNFKEPNGADSPSPES